MLFKADIESSAMRWKDVYLALVLPMAITGAVEAVTRGGAMSEWKTLMDFSDGDKTKWSVVNDGVMGGISQSRIQRTSRETAVFAGVLSLENNGGFASVRAVVGPLDLSSYAGIEIRVRGDGRSYQLRLRTNDRFDGAAYRAHFETHTGEWVTARIPFDQFVPTFRGRTLSDAPALEPSRIHQIGFLLADKTPGPFSLEIDFVRAFKPATIDS